MLLLVKITITLGGRMMIYRIASGCFRASDNVLLLDLGVVTPLCSGFENSLSCKLF